MLEVSESITESVGFLRSVSAEGAWEEPHEYVAACEVRERRRTSVLVRQGKRRRWCAGRKLRHGVSLHSFTRDRRYHARCPPLPAQVLGRRSRGEFIPEFTGPRPNADAMVSARRTGAFSANCNAPAIPGNGIKAGASLHATLLTRSGPAVLHADSSPVEGSPAIDQSTMVRASAAKSSTMRSG